MKTAYAFRCLIVSLALLATAPAYALTTLTFDDAAFPTAPVFNSVHPAGVTFTATPDDFNSSLYGATAFGGLTLIDGLALEIGAQHTLDLTFESAVSSLQFGVAHNLPTDFDFVTVTVLTRGGSTLDASFQIPFPLFDGPSETLFSYTGAGDLALVALSIAFPGEFFNAETDRFQIDNLTFQTAAPVPEPSTYAMLMAGLLLLGWTAVRRRQS